MNEPIIGQSYLLFRDGKHIGEGVWTEDKWNGPCFIGEGNTVFIDVDAWVLKAQKLRINE